MWKIYLYKDMVVDWMIILNKLLSFINEIRSQKLKINVCEDEINGLVCISIQFPYKSTPPIFKDPLDLAKESYSTSMISETDFSIIMDSILENQKRIIEKKYKKKCRIVKHQFSDQLNEPLVIYKELSTNKTHIKPAREIYSSLKQINEFDSQDSACIGNLVGCSETEKEYRQRFNSKKKDSIVKLDIQF